MGFAHTVDGVTWSFADLRELLAKASPHRSGDVLAGVAAGSAEERMAARLALADVPVRDVVRTPVVPYEEDDVTRLVADRLDAAALAPVAHLTVGELRE
jgi:ethanolamine ammonia-lyase large subunit